MLVFSYLYYVSIVNIIGVSKSSLILLYSLYLFIVKNSNLSIVELILELALNSAIRRNKA